MNRRGSNVVVVLAFAVTAFWMGGLIALGAVVAPVVFRLVPAPLSGTAMGLVFRRFDGVAMTCSAVVLACEAALAAMHRVSRRDSGVLRTRTSDAARVAVASALAGLAAFGGVVLTPRISELHESGAIRGLGELGEQLERAHHLAELAAKGEVLLGLTLLALYGARVAGSRHAAQD